MISSNVVFVPIDLGVDQMSPVIVDQRHQLTVARRINLADFSRSFVVIVEELSDVAKIVFPDYQPKICLLLIG